jgi:Flp pilus assembly protein TadD
MPKPSPTPTPTLSRLEQLVQKARKLRHRGETRKALQALREACLLDEQSAWLWTLYGYHLTCAHRLEEARQAFRQALWLRRSSGDERRLRSTQALVARLASPSFAA